jgi:hypothetical protein
MAKKMIEKPLHITLKQSNMNNKIGSELICPRGVWSSCSTGVTRHVIVKILQLSCKFITNKGNNKITELRAILQRESQNS